MIEMKDIQKHYLMGENSVHALNDVSITVEAGEFVAIMGPSGSGKSTLMHIMGLLDVPDAGSYRVNGQEVSKLDEDQLALLRCSTMGFIFQQFNLLPRITAQENVSLPLLYSGRRKDSGRAKDLLKQVQLANRAGHRPNELSGGQQQRVAIARSLVNAPRIIFADEPTGNLDSVSEQEILALLKDLNSQGITIVMVTHEESVAKYAHRLIRMRDGKIVSDERRVSATFKGVETSWIKEKESQQASKILEIFEYLKEGVGSLGVNKIRTALSMLGIVIGVAAVIAMLALGKGAENAIQAQLSSLGTNLLVLRPGGVRVGGIATDAGTVTKLTLEDADAIRNEVSGVQDVSPAVNGRTQVSFEDKNWSTQTLGAAPSYAEMHHAVPEVGRFFTDEEVLKRDRVAVIGMTLVKQLFGDRDPVGEKIKINKTLFQVIGVLPEKGATGWRDQDDMIVVPVTTAMYRLFGKTHADYIDIEVKDLQENSTVQDGVLRVMFTRHNIPVSQQEDSLEIRNMADIQAALSESSRTMSLLLASIAAISLLVGGIGIMNIMLVSVTERTREIGLRKAVGAKRGDILAQFLGESIVITTMGGIFGIALGWLITVILSRVVGWASSISPFAVMGAFGFSVSIGILFGIYPARKASLLNPIEALRYE